MYSCHVLPFISKQVKQQFLSKDVLNGNLNYSNKGECMPRSPSKRAFLPGLAKGVYPFKARAAWKIDTDWLAVLSDIMGSKLKIKFVFIRLYLSNLANCHELGTFTAMSNSTYSFSMEPMKLTQRGFIASIIARGFSIIPLYLGISKNHAPHQVSQN